MTSTPTNHHHHNHHNNYNTASSPSSSSSLHRSPVVWILVCLSCVVWVVSLAMVNLLEDFRRDDDFLFPGNSNGIGSSSSSSSGGSDGLALRGRDPNHPHNLQDRDDQQEVSQRKRRGGGGGGGVLGALFGQVDKIRRRRGNGGNGDGGGKNMKDAIRDFREAQVRDKQQRIQRGIYTVREAFERDNPRVYDDLEHDIAALRQALPPMSSSVSSDSDLPYDIYHCPFDPPTPRYPLTWNVMTVLDHWNPDDTDIPQDRIHQGLCVFDWNNPDDRKKALRYRDQYRVPFVVQNYPEVMKAAKRWTSTTATTPEREQQHDPQVPYLEALVGNQAIRNEHSHNNHFMYWKTRYPIPDFTPPTDMVSITFREWYDRAQHLEQQQQAAADNLVVDQTKQEHWYFRLNAVLDKHGYEDELPLLNAKQDRHGYVYEELPFFDPTKGESLTMMNPLQHRGINCRFGMKGVIAETHFDSSDNFIAIMGGKRRYILAHPDQCINMELYPQSHPSGRHSSVNWSTAAKQFQNNKDKSQQQRPFAQAQVNEVVLQAGDLMYLPTFWFHFIVSLDINYQCNSRSGDTDVYEKYIRECGFRTPQRRGQVSQPA